MFFAACDAYLDGIVNYFFFLQYQVLQPMIKYISLNSARMDGKISCACEQPNNKKKNLHYHHNYAVKKHNHCFYHELIAYKIDWS